MKRRALVAAASLLILLAGCHPDPNVGGPAEPPNPNAPAAKSTVNIWAYIPKSVENGGGPYTLHVEALDKTTGQQLKNDDTPVTGEYGPAALLYDSGHVVELMVVAKLGKPIPMTSYIRIQDGGLTKPKKTCTPATKDLTELRCTITTKY